MQTEKNLVPMAFKFDAASQEIRSLLIKNEPWFVAKDICDILEHSDTSMALSKLDDDEKLTQKIFGSGQKRKMWLVNESGLYALILRSNKPEAKIFRKWVTSEVLPAIRKKGYYHSGTKLQDFIDARDIPPTFTELNKYAVTTVMVEPDKPWFSINDIHRAIHSATPAGQTAKKLNAKRQLAIKIHTYGGTHPAWFTNQIGLELVLSGSRILNQSNQLRLSI